MSAQTLIILYTQCQRRLIVGYVIRTLGRDMVAVGDERALQSGTVHAKRQCGYEF
jgi:hypothetical protein